MNKTGKILKTNVLVRTMSNIFKSYNELSTLGARVLHAPHPDGRPKAGKTSGRHEANEVSDV